MAEDFVITVPGPDVCPHCVEKDIIIASLTKQLENLQTKFVEDRASSGSKPDSGKTVGKTDAQKQGLQAPFFSKKRRPSVSNAQWMSEEDHISNWPPSYLALFLAGNKLEYLKPLLFPESRADLQFATSQTKMFDSNPQIPNTVSLVSAPVDVLLNFLFLLDEDSLHKVWPHPTFQRDFVLTFQYFMSPKDLFDSIRGRLEGKPHPKLIGSLGHFVNLMNELMQTEFDSFSGYTQQFEATFDMPKRVEKPKPGASPASERSEKSEKRAHLLAKTADKGAKSPVDRSPRGIRRQESLHPDLKGSLFNLLSLPARALAEELTLWSEELLSKVTLKEFYNKQWERESGAENLKAFMDHSNKIGYWVSTSIISPIDIQQRTNTIVQFIHVAQALLELRNFHDLQCVLASLESSQVRKLKKTWAALHQKEQHELQVLLDLMDGTDNHRRYCEYIAEMDPTTTQVIPLMTMTLHDLFMVEEKMSNISPENHEHINWVKMQSIATKIWKIRQWRKSSFSSFYTPSPEIRKWVESQVVWDDGDIQYEIAILRENTRIQRSPDLIVSARGVMPVLSSTEVAALKVKQTSMKCKKGTIIVDVGDICKQPFFLVHGSIAMESTIWANSTIASPAFFSTQFWSKEFVSMCKFTAVSDEVEYIAAYDAVQLVDTCQVVPGLFPKINVMAATHIAMASKKTVILPSMTRALTRGMNSTAVFKSKSNLGGQELKQWKCSKKGSVGSAVGLLSISDTHFHFIGTSFGIREVKEKVPIKSIKNITSKKKEIKIKLKDDDISLSFSSSADTKQIFEFLTLTWKTELIREGVAQQDQRRNESVEAGGTPVTDQALEWEPTKDEWELIIKGAKELNVKAGETIISQGKTRTPGVYQLTKGTCNISVTQPGGLKPKVLETLNTNDIFGEIAYILGAESVGASASVIASTDCSVLLIEGYFLEELFAYYPRIQGSFFGYLAKVVTERVAQNVESTTPPPTEASPEKS